MDCSYYVYINQDINGEVFYIGKGKVPGSGRTYRHINWFHRSKEWTEKAKDGFTSQILSYGSERDMFYLEKELIKGLGLKGMELVNKYHNINYESLRKGITFKNWKSDKSSPEYIKKRRQQRFDYYKKLKEEQ